MLVFLFCDTGRFVVGVTVFVTSLGGVTVTHSFRGHRIELLYLPRFSSYRLAVENLSFPSLSLGAGKFMRPNSSISGSDFSAPLTVMQRRYWLQETLQDCQIVSFRSLLHFIGADIVL